MDSKSATGTEYVNAQLIDLKDLIDKYAKIIAGLKKIRTIKSVISLSSRHVTLTPTGYVAYLGAYLGTYNGERVYLAQFDNYLEQSGPLTFYLTRYLQPNPFGPLFFYLRATRGGFLVVRERPDGWAVWMASGTYVDMWQPITNSRDMVLSEKIPISTQNPMDAQDWTPDY